MRLVERVRNDRVRVPARIDTRFRGGMAAGAEIDRPRLAQDLRAVVEGEVRFDTATRAMYATDASNYRQPPIGVVIPRTIASVVATHDVCRRYGAPILPRGAGTSLSGETVNYAVVIDFSKYLNAIGDPDPDRRIVTVQPGAINEKVNEHTGRWGLMFAPDPSTHGYCTIGGNVGNNSCGIHSVQAEFHGQGARTSDNVHSLEVLTYDGLRMEVGRTTDDELERIVAAGGRRGEIYAKLRALRDRYEHLIRERFPQIPRRVSGYNLDELLPENGFNLARALVGSEGTCVTVLSATLLLVEKPKAKSLLVIGYPDIFSCGDHIPQVREHRPLGIEGIDHVLFEHEQLLNVHPRELQQLPKGDGWLLVEFGGDSKEDADEKARELMARLEKDEQPPVDMSLFDDEEQERRLWQVREAGLAATAFPPDGHDYWPGWEDAAVPPERVGDYLRDFRKLLEKYGYRGALYGHLGQGCIHTHTNFDLRTADGIRDYRRFVEEAADLVVSYGGSLSGEHGDGQSRAELLPRMYGEELVQAFREFKSIWDPEWKMNPGKVVDPYRLDEDLKLGSDYNPWRPKVRFAYEADGGDFAHAALRCVGVGKCRQPDGVDVMCPSYIVTREEMHTTRGRARLFYEMLKGDIVTGGWRSKEVKEALELCLACKGCTKDCPVHVDMPTYKAEFWYHHYAGHVRPRHAYAFGLIDQASRLASKLPGFVNFLTHAPGTSRLLKLAADMASEREFPTFAPLTLQDWFRERGGTRNPGGPRLILWPDTFSNYFRTDVGVAAVEALEALGFHVVVPSGHVCCGRPLYDYGFLDLAEKYLRRTLEQLRDDVRAGTPVIGLEPSCLAVFKDELRKLLPNDDDGLRLCENAYHFSEFLQERSVELPRLDRKAILWGHCHQKATGGTHAEQELLEKMGLEVEQVTGGCCGLAGSWGFEADHYEISTAIGEHALLPKVREADPTALIVADGFSCKTQIEEGNTGRRALHLAQVIKMALDHGAQGPPGSYPERFYDQVRPQASLRRRAARAAALVAAGGGLIGGAAAIARR